MDKSLSNPIHVECYKPSCLEDGEEILSSLFSLWNWEGLLSCLPGNSMWEVFPQVSKRLSLHSLKLGHLDPLNILMTWTTQRRRKKQQDSQDRNNIQKASRHTSLFQRKILAEILVVEERRPEESNENTQSLGTMTRNSWVFVFLHAKGIALCWFERSLCVFISSSCLFQFPCMSRNFLCCREQNIPRWITSSPVLNEQPHLDFKMRRE